jgi:beta-glucosidase-like glycosyl hydrolase
VDGVATVFPASIGLAATFNTELLGKIGKAISDESKQQTKKKINIIGFIKSTLIK